ncbi:hypothetical protein V5799_016823 [Amblyomma americanum]|uniref:Uncharacterized protein n=1 Tax=Amblyomma americanum TaxID=6943 RepID=A0AAQ4EAZ7_AMBAM
MYVNGTQKCVEKKEQRPQKPVPLPTVPPNNTNETQQESQESQESQEVQQTPKKPRFNLSGNNFPGIPDFLTHKLRPTATPVPVPVTPSSAPAEGEGPAPSVPTVPVPAGPPEIPGGTAIPPLPYGFTLVPNQDEEEEGLPGQGTVPELPPPPMMAPQGPPVVEEQGLPGEGDVPQLPPPPLPLDNAEKDGAPLNRTSRSAQPPPDALLEEQSLVASPVQSAVDGPPFNFDALDGNQQRIL